MHHAYIGFGSNLGDSLTILDAVIHELDVLDGFRVTAVAPVYRSRPVDVPDQQPDYLNCVLGVDTTFDPLTVLHVLQDLEDRHGRIRGDQRNLARTIDLDLLVMGDQTMETDELQLPHPRIAQRAFVLFPLHDIAPTLDIPGVGVVEELLDNVRDQEIIRI